MSFRARIALVVLAVLIAVGVWASAQVRQPVDPPIVLSGSDLGFRVSAREGNTPVGTLVVRVNGQWVEVLIGGFVLKPATH